MKLVWSARFTRALKKFVRRRPALLHDLNAALQQLEAGPHHPALRTHKLGGDLKGSWACSAGYDARVLFDFVRNPKSNEVEIHLLSIGTHDEVY